MNRLLWLFLRHHEDFEEHCGHLQLAEAVGVGEGHLLLCVLSAHDEVAGCWKAVSARATSLLHVVLNRLGQRAVHHTANVGLVHAKPESHCGHDLKRDNLMDGWMDEWRDG